METVLVYLKVIKSIDECQTLNKNEILKVAPTVHNSNTKLQWVKAYTFLHER